MAVHTIAMADVYAADVSTMLEEAVAFGAWKMRAQNAQTVVDAIHKGSCEVCQYVKYSLARQIGGYLGSVDDSVKALYVYEPDYAVGVYDGVGQEPNLSSGINMIAWVDRKTAALSSVLASLDEDLRQAREPLLCPKATRICYSLDVVAVDDDEVSNRRGYGALIGSTYVHPTKVWDRTARST